MRPDGRPDAAAAGADDLAWVALGGNVGDSHAVMRGALAALAELGEVVARSSLYRTAPVGGPAGQADYLNAVVALRTGLSTHGLLRALQDVEERFGRVRGERWGPRTLDLDLLAHGAVNVDDPVATVPHPRLHHRAFVLVPLREIDPWWRHPVTGETAEGMLARLDASGVERTELAW
ncbi:MAG TPA: 2-amino-4-hydroxy-6-hydroxymethyldihydropteridine diphosphokinase [Trueperaceae bacterium]|nr:2-amino-4-hydroxy-6-hydroxymethyldihydropteridine diphosphokinase [Trueperaceae bacterium]